MAKWRKISLCGTILGYAALLLDYFIIPIPHAIMIPLLLIGIGLIFAGLIARRKQKKA